MKHLLKIGGLVIVSMCIFVGNAFACDDLLSPPILADSYAMCMIRNIDDKRQIDGTIEIYKDGSLGGTTPFSLNPGEVEMAGFSDGTGVYYCNFEVSKRKRVSASICSDLGCMAVPRK